MEKVLEKLKEGSIVAFKTKETQIWYTGEVRWLRPPNSQFNPKDEWYIHIELNVPIQPQWYEDGDKTNYYLEDIIDLKILE